MIIAPPGDTELGLHSTWMTISGANTALPLHLGVWALVTSAVKGEVAFSVETMFGQDVPGAEVRLVNETLYAQRRATTDELGEVTIGDLDPGTWSYQVTASGSGSARGVVEVIADQVVEEVVQLERSLVSIEYRNFE